MKKVLFVFLLIIMLTGTLASCAEKRTMATSTEHAGALGNTSASAPGAPESEPVAFNLPGELSESGFAPTDGGASGSLVEAAPSRSEPDVIKVSKPANLSGEEPISPWDYQALLGKGMDVDWSKTNQGVRYYSSQTAADFAEAGVSHVRIRIADKATKELLESLDQQIKDCLENGIIPVIAYQADAFKNDPSEETIQKVQEWWGKVARHYQDASYLLSFDLLIEATDSLNKQPEKLNEIYERLVTEIRKTNSARIIMISPRLRSDAAYLRELVIPTEHRGYLMAEWHFYASGPSKTNDRKLWTTGTEEERALIAEKIGLALNWQEETGIPTWVGAWMPGNYNDGNEYTVEEQVLFARYMTESLTKAGIPFAVNSDTKFYDRKTNRWVAEMQPVMQCIYQ